MGVKPSDGNRGGRDLTKGEFSTVHEECDCFVVVELSATLPEVTASW